VTKIKANYSDIVKLKGWQMTDTLYRAMLDYIAPKCYVEAESTGQYGTVKKIIYNRNGLPVCVKVKCEVPICDGNNNKTITINDYISIDRISFFEPYDTYCISVNEYSDSYAKCVLNPEVEDGERSI
jgi:hypothetical protein